MPLLPYLFRQVSEAVRWIVCHVSGHCNILVYVDDFLIICEGDHGVCARIVKVMHQVCKDLGVPLADEKEEGPSTSMVFQADSQADIKPAGWQSQ